MKNIHNQKNQGGDLYYLDFICLNIYNLKAYLISSADNTK